MKIIIKNNAVFYLARHCNDISQFKRFIYSYRENKPSIDHDLIIIFKGFNNNTEKKDYINILYGITHLQFNTNDHGLDITAYINAANRYKDEYHFFCFLNSHSNIISNNWLDSLYKNINKTDIGLVGATGSWQSLRGSSSSLSLILTSLIYTFFIIFKTTKFKEKMDNIKDIKNLLLYLFNHNAFPNPHIRTNAFIIRPDHFLQAYQGNIITKNDAYNFESGKAGLSNHIIKLGLKIAIIGRDGILKFPKDWPSSNIYMSGNQENLLISDNVTRQFQQASSEFRADLSNMAWKKSNIIGKFYHWRLIANKRRYDLKIQKQQQALLDINKEHSSPTNIIIFGAGTLGHFFNEWINKNCPNIKIMHYIDTNLNQSSYNDAPVLRPNSLIENIIEYDYILISSNRYHDEIYKTIKKMNISTSKII